MTFAEILPSLIAGQPVYRKGWNDGHFIYYEEDWNHFSEAWPDTDWHTLCTFAPLRGSEIGRAHV